MRISIFVLSFLCLTVGCNTYKMSPQETVTQYYQARDAGDFKKLMSCVADSITIIEGDYIMPYNHDEFNEVFRWDSIFQPSYEIVSMEESGNQIIASVAISSLRNNFLKNKRMTCKYRLSFISQKINKVQSLDCTEVDWKAWQMQVDSLVDWIDEMHPELNGFIHDMSMNGAINYMKAIDYYQIEKDK